MAGEDAEAAQGTAAAADHGEEPADEAGDVTDGAPAVTPSEHRERGALPFDTDALAPAVEFRRGEAYDDTALESAVDEGVLRPSSGPIAYDATDLAPAVRKASLRPSWGPVAYDSEPLDSAVREWQARKDDYSWVDYLDEYGPESAAEQVREQRQAAAADAVRSRVPEGGGSEMWPPYPTLRVAGADAPDIDWASVDYDPTPDLGFEPEARDAVVDEAARRAKRFHAFFDEYTNPETTPVVKDEWLWEHYKRIYYYVGENNWTRPRDEDGEIIRFDQSDALGFDPDRIEHWLATKHEAGEGMLDLEDERTVNVREDVDEDAFFSDLDGNTTLANRYDLEKAVSMEKKRHFREVERYWVNKPAAFVVIFHSDRENEKKYYLVEPYRNEIEEDLREFLTGKLRTAIKYASDDVAAAGDADQRRRVIERETRKLLDRYDLYDDPADASESLVDRLLAAVGQRAAPGDADDADDGPHLDGIRARPEPVVLAEDPEQLTEYQLETLLYTLQRNFVGYERIDGVKHDINVEDISCDGYHSPVFVYHTDYENLITNVHHGEENLDDFVVKLAQRSGKGISKRQPQVDATLPDGSRAQLTLGNEVSDHGTNYTIRQFKDVPFTPVDLVNWQTFSLDEMAFLWLCIENHKSIVFAGGTASGKTTSLNAVSLFIPSNTKIVSIEDTREVELPQRNWIASVTRPSFGEDETGDIDEFDLLEAALRQRPDYIVMGEVRGEEGRTLFQVMSTGHTTYTTFHADNVGEVLKRFTTEPINVSKTLFTALDLVSIQSQTRIRGKKVRRNRSITEINRYDPENDEINVNDVFQWEPEDDEYRQTADSSTLEEIRFDRGWSKQELDREMQERRVILAYLIAEGLNEYAEVAATAQAYINDPDTILTLVANDQLRDALDDLRGMESVLIDVDPDKEEMVPRPDPSDAVLAEAEGIIETAREDGGVLAAFEGDTPDSLAAALAPDDATEDDVVADTRDLDAEDLESAIREVGEDVDFLDRTRVDETASDEAADSTGADTDPADSDTGDDADTGASDSDGDGFGGFEPATAEDDAAAGRDTDSESSSEAADGGRPLGEDADDSEEATGG
jgi:flagellar protein FlaI